MTDVPDAALQPIDRDVTIDLDEDGLVSVWTVNGWAWVTAKAAVDLAARAGTGTGRVTVGGAVRSKLGRPVAERIAGVADADIVDKSGGHPAGWSALAVVDAGHQDRGAVELVERATEAGELDRLMLGAVRQARPHAYELFRTAKGLEATGVPDGVSPDAISIPRVRRDDRWMAWLIGAMLALLILVPLLTQDSFGLEDVLDWKVLVFLGILAAGIVLLGRAHRHRAVCFDGPRIWDRRSRNNWYGPIDLRQVGIYFDSPGRGGVSVGLAIPDPAGDVFDAPKMISKQDWEHIESTGARFRNHLVVVDGDFLLKGLGDHLSRHIDRDSCIIGRHGTVLDRPPESEPRQYDGLASTEVN